MTTRLRHLVPAALLLLSSVSPAVADLSSTLESCVLGMNDDSYQFNAISDACPEALDLIEDYQLGESLGSDWRKSLTYWQAEHLEYFESYYQTRSSDVRVINPSSLDEIVEQLENPEYVPERASLWERFKNWLRETFRDEEEATPAWLDEWLSDFRVPQSVLEASFWVIAASIVIAALVVVAMEIRAARTGVRPSRYVLAAAGATGSRNTYRMYTLRDLESAGTQDKPAILLRLIAQRMEKLGVLVQSRSSTHRELVAGSTQLGDAARRAVTAVSASAERIRYGDRQLGESEVRDVVAAGVGLLEGMKDRQGHA